MADNVNRKISVGAEDEGFEDLINRLEQSGSQMYENIVQKAEEYSDRLNEQAERAKNLLEREKELKEAAAERKRELAEQRREEKMANLGSGGASSGEEKKRVTQEYKQEIQGVNRELKEQQRVINEADRQQREHFTRRRDEQQQQQQQGGGMMGGMGGAIGGGAIGFLTGGGVAGLGGALAGGLGKAVGSSSVFGNSLPDLSGITGPLAGAMLGYGSQFTTEASTTAAMGAGPRAFGTDDPWDRSAETAKLGMTLSQRSQLERQAAQQAATAEASDNEDGEGFMETRRLEQSMGMDLGAAMGITSMRQMGLDRETSDLLKDFLAEARNSDVWRINKGDFAAMPREMKNLQTLIQEQSRIMQDPSAGQAIGLRTAFAEMDTDETGGIFSGSRGMEMIMGIHKGMQSPQSEFTRAREIQATMENMPEGVPRGGVIGLTAMQKGMQKGIFQKGRLASVIEQERRAGADPKRAAARLVQRYPSLMPAWDTEEILDPDKESPLLNLIEQGPELLEEGGKAEFAEAAKKMGMRDRVVDEILGSTGSGVARTEEANNRVVNNLQNIGGLLSEEIAGGINTMADYIREDLVPDIKQLLEWVRENGGDIVDGLTSGGNEKRSDNPYIPPYYPENEKEGEK